MKLPRSLRRAAGRYSGKLPAGVRPLLRTLGRLGGEHAKVGLPSGRVLVLSAHPDDETLGCGGTIARLAARGDRVPLVIATDGDALLVTEGSGDLASRRRAEATEACRILGIEAPRFLGHRDRGLSRTHDRLVEDLGGIVHSELPDVIMLPWFGDANDDHNALNHALCEVPMPGSTQIWGYEIWSPLPANRLVEISEVIETKRSALLAHAADTLLDLEAMLGLNRYRSEMGRLNGDHAEAFLQLPAGQYFDLVTSTSG